MADMVSFVAERRRIWRLVRRNILWSPSNPLCRTRQSRTKPSGI